MKYKISEVSQITNVPIETIRYYEKIGVISPKVDPSNNYRYYSAWDINFIFDFNNYRRLDYSTKDALNFIHGATLEEQTEILRLKNNYYQNKINHYEALLNRNNSLLDGIQHLSHSLGKITIEQSPSYYYIAYRKNYDFHGFKNYKDELNLWLQNLEITDNIIIVEKESMLTNGNNDYHWGLMLTEDNFNDTKLPRSENIRHIPSHLCVKTIVETGGEGTFHYSVLNPALDYIQKHNFKLCGNPYAILLIRSHSDQSMHRYFSFYLPIEE